MSKEICIGTGLTLIKLPFLGKMQTQSLLQVAHKLSHLIPCVSAR